MITTKNFLLYTKESKVVAKRDVYTGKWLKFCHLDYTIGDKTFTNYEMTERNMDRKGRIYDGIGIAAILEGKDKPKQFLVIANFRPPVDGYILEFPGGLSEGDNLLEDINRELEEETGYVATEIIKDFACPEVYSEPGITNSCGKLVFVKVNLDDERNKNPKQKLEETEDIRVHLVPLDNMFSSIMEIAEKNKYKIIERLLLLAVGFEMSKKFSELNSL